MKTLNEGLHAIVILFIFVAIGFAIVSLAFCIYNARKVPYQSMKGPLGLYLWNFIAGLMCFAELYFNKRSGISNNEYWANSVLIPPALSLSQSISGLFGSLASLCFLASVCHHNLTERVANYKESFFNFVVLEEDFGFSFWLCVVSAALHGANILVVAMSKIHLPKIQTKKPEEPTVTGDDLLY